MSQLDQATQQNSNISQIGASAAVQLTAQSEQLEKLVSQLQAAVFGERSDLSEPPSTPSVELNESTPGPKFEVKPEIKVEPKVEVKPVQTERKASSVTKPVDPGLGVPNSNDPRFEDL
jgi:hypothetical protein